MNEQDKEFLPAGSIVRIRFDDSLYMIFAHLPVVKENEGKVLYDYAAIKYPFGMSSEDDTIYFNKDLIKNVIFKGYKDEEYVKYNEILNKVNNNYKNGGK